jgi:hypothetical protein
MGCFDIGFACCKPGALALSKAKFSAEFGMPFVLARVAELVDALL